MSEISVNFSTESQKFSVTIDGKKVANVIEATVFSDKVKDFLGQEEDMFVVRVVSREDTDSGKTGKHQTVTFVSQHSSEGKKALESGIGVKYSEGLICIKQTSDSELIDDVNQYFGV